MHLRMLASFFNDWHEIVKRSGQALHLKSMANTKIAIVDEKIMPQVFHEQGHVFYAIGI